MSGGYRDPDTVPDPQKEMDAELASAMARDRARDEKRRRRGAILASLLYGLMGLAVAYGFIDEFVRHGLTWDLLLAPAPLVGVIGLSLLVTFVGMRLRKKADQNDLVLQRRATEAAEFIAAQQKRASEEEAKHRVRVGVDFGIPAEQLRVGAEPLEEADADADAEAPDAAKGAR